MRTKLLLALVISLSACCLLTLQPSRASAASLQIRPLLYQESLRTGETKKGFVDISNPTATALTLDIKVRGFRQVDGQGNLQFFASDVLSKGVTLDISDVELGPKEAARVYFLIDSNKLPVGDVFAAIFAATQSPAVAGVTSSAQVGTLLFIENGQPGQRKASIESIKMPTFQFGDAIQGAVTVKNQAPANTVTGFFPEVQLSLGPIREVNQKVQGPLLMAGIARNVNVDITTSRFGLYRFSAASSGGRAEKWLFVVTGYWRWVIVAGAGLCTLALYVFQRGKRRRPVSSSAVDARSDAELPAESSGAVPAEVGQGDPVDAPAQPGEEAPGPPVEKDTAQEEQSAIGASEPAAELPSETSEGPESASDRKVPVSRTL